MGKKIIPNFDEFCRKSNKLTEGAICDIVKRASSSKIRTEDIIEIAGCRNEHDFVDGNGNRHMNGFLPTNWDQLYGILCALIKKRGNKGDFNDICTSEIKSMKGLFANNFAFNGDISGWDVSNIRDFSYMFYEATSFNGDLSKWNVSKGVNFSSMFCRATSFNQDISNWDVSKGEDFHKMFFDATSFNQDISNWDVSNGDDFLSFDHGAGRRDILPIWMKKYPNVVEKLPF